MWLQTYALSVTLFHEHCHSMFSPQITAGFAVLPYTGLVLVEMGVQKHCLHNFAIVVLREAWLLTNYIQINCDDFCHYEYLNWRNYKKISTDSVLKKKAVFKDASNYT